MNELLDVHPRLAPVAETVALALVEVSRVFDGHLSSDLPPVVQLVGHVERYRGKMLRPTLVTVAGLAAHPEIGRSPATLLPLLSPAHFAVAAVCEMVHMATLVHDDVLDEADTRRRGQTVNHLHGNETAVILGDYLIASAYHLCSQQGTPRAALAVGLASTVMCEGELMQLHHRGDYSLDEATYYEIVERKTAELIATSAELGAELSGASAPGCGALREYGRRVGIAFQIQDDLLDLTGDERTVGKSVGKDLEKGKLTLPLIHYLATTDALSRGRALRLIERACGETGRDSRAAAAEIAGILARSHAVAYAQDAAAAHVRAAKESLAGLDDSPARDMLGAMADAVITRAF